jgi:hypothetical protein
MNPLFAMYVTARLVRLSGVDLAIIAFYFALVLVIGFYLKRFAKTGEDFFLAGREMTAWVAGLAFVSANLGSLELLGWAGSAYQYGIMAAHWYWVGAILFETALRFRGQRTQCHNLCGDDHHDVRREHVRHGRGHEGCPGLEHQF